MMLLLLLRPTGSGEGLSPVQIIFRLTTGQNGGRWTGETLLTDFPAELLSGPGWPQHQEAGLMSGDGVYATVHLHALHAGEGGARAPVITAAAGH